MDLFKVLNEVSESAQVTDDQNEQINAVMKSALTDAIELLSTLLKIVEEVNGIIADKKVGWQVKIGKRKLKIDKARDQMHARWKKAMDDIENVFEHNQRIMFFIALAKHIQDNKSSVGALYDFLSSLDAVSDKLQMSEKQLKKKDDAVKVLTAKHDSYITNIAKDASELQGLLDKNDIKTTEKVLDGIRKKARKINDKEYVVSEMKKALEFSQLPIIMHQMMTTDREKMKEMLKSL